MLADWRINWTKTSLNRQEILGIVFTNFTNAAPEARGFGLNNCLKSQAVFGSVHPDCKDSQLWTEKCPDFQKVQGLRS